MCGRYIFGRHKNTYHLLGHWGRRPQRSGVPPRRARLRFCGEWLRRNSLSEIETCGSYYCIRSYHVIPFCTMTQLYMYIYIYAYITHHSHTHTHIYIYICIYTYIIYLSSLTIPYYDHDCKCPASHACKVDGRLWPPGRCQRTVMRNQRKCPITRPNCCGNE